MVFMMASMFRPGLGSFLRKAEPILIDTAGVAIVTYVVATEASSLLRKK